MFLDFFLKGVLLSVYVVVPIGAISILYIKRTLQNGFSSGIASALGVTTVEGFYAAAAIYGLTFISDFLITWKVWLQSFGTVFLVLIGLRILLSKERKNIKVAKKKNLLQDYVSMLVLTSVNPLTIIGFIAIFTSFGAGIDQNFNHSLAMLLGFISSSFFYCMFLIAITSLLKSRFFANDGELIQMISQISGLVIILFTISAYIISLVSN